MPIQTADAVPNPEAPAIAPPPPSRNRRPRFLREFWLRILVISALLTVPCFWHVHLEAGDVASHTYNAWLVQLIERGQAPGLWLARPSSNVLFDECLSALGKLLGLRPAEKSLVAICVLLYFWSAFALVFAISRRVPWFLVPCLAMFSYGWAFQQGLINYYLSLALGFAGLALVAGGRGASRWLGIPLLPLMWLAHPLGALLFLAGAAYLALARTLEAWQQYLLAAVAALVLFGLNFYLSARYLVARVGPLSLAWEYNGFDQLSLYGPRYHLLLKIFMAFALGCLLVDVAMRRRQRPSTAGPQEIASGYGLPLQLYALSFWAVLLLPNAVLLPQFSSPISLLTSRATAVCAIFLCALLGVMRPRRWHLAGFGLLAGAYFLFLYQDTGKVDHMEAQVERFVRALPPGARVLATIWPFYRSRIFNHHILDRACIGHCFSYANYEPSNGQFRVRANPGNGMVFADARQVTEVRLGGYVVQPGDLPIFEVYQCNDNLTDLCMRQLAAGDKTGEKGPHPSSR